MAKKSKVVHVAGNFYSVTTKSGTFIGSKEKAELFEQGKHDPAFKQIVADGVPVEALAAN